MFLSMNELESIHQLNSELCSEAQDEAKGDECTLEILTDTFDICKDYAERILYLREHSQRMPTKEISKKPEIYRTPLGQMLKEAREHRGAKGASLQQTASNMNMSKAWLVGVEQDATINEEMLIKLCTYYRVDPAPFIEVLNHPA